jgi:hypothetical protein
MSTQRPSAPNSRLLLVTGTRLSFAACVILPCPSQCGSRPVPYPELSPPDETRRSPIPS